MISFFVPGIAKTAGSKRAFVPKGWKRAIVTDACAKSKDWKADVKSIGASFATADCPLQCPLRLDLVFIMQRPKYHYTAKWMVKGWAPGRHFIKPDVLKLARAVEDALTGVLWVDDCQIAIEILSKQYGEKPGVLISLKPLPTQLSMTETIEATFSHFPPEQHAPSVANYLPSGAGGANAPSVAESSNTTPQ